MSMKCDSTADIHKNFQVFGKPKLKKAKLILHEIIDFRDFRGHLD